MTTPKIKMVILRKNETLLSNFLIRSAQTHITPVIACVGDIFDFDDVFDWYFVLYEGEWVEGDLFDVVATYTRTTHADVLEVRVVNATGFAYECRVLRSGVDCCSCSKCNAKRDRLIYSGFIMDGNI